MLNIILKMANYFNYKLKTNKQETMKVKELINLLQKCDQNLEVNTFNN